jgi:hypothetical protein
MSFLSRKNYYQDAFALWSIYLFPSGINILPAFFERSGLHFQEGFLAVLEQIFNVFLP